MRKTEKITIKNKEMFIIPDGIVVIDKHQKIVIFNEAASRISGLNENDAIGKSITILFHEDAEDLHYFGIALRDNRNFSNLSISIIDKQRNKKNVLASVTPIKKDDEVISVIFVFRDTNEMLLMAQEITIKTAELIDQKNKLDAIFNSNIEGTFTIDQDWTVTSFNNSAAKITGYNKNEAIGKKCWEIFNSARCRNGCHMEQTLLKGKPTIGNELDIVDKNGKITPIRVNSAVLINNQNKKTGAVETFIDISEIRNLTAHLENRFHYANIIGKNKELEKAFYLIDNVSKTDSTVLITGESGTGKELIARSIHLSSQRFKGPFIALNCSAFVESLIESELFGHEKGSFTGAVSTKTGKFEMSQGGTLFLDEIGDISLAVQTKLLRVIETGIFERVGGNTDITMNTRIIAATNKDIKAEIASGRFREDFYYRINVVNIHLPPLRARKDDILLLVNHFLNHFNTKFKKTIKQFSSLAFARLMEYDWPGNIRELENVIEHCFVLCRSDIIQENDLPKYIRMKQTESSMLLKPKTHNHFLEAEQEIIINALKNNDGSKSKTAAELNIDTSTLWRKMKKLGINLK